MTELDPAFIERWNMHEEAIRLGEEQAIRARWETGREALALREGKQLPRGALAAIREQWNISQQELSNRIRFAEAYDESELTTRVVGSGLTWTEVRSSLPRKRPPTTRVPKEAAPPTKATLKDAEKVVELFKKPDVVAEVKRRVEADEKARKAAVAVARYERNQAQRQKEEDQSREQVYRVLRERLLEGQTDWADLTEQMDIFSDSLNRYCELMDGLPFPDQFRQKRLDSEIGKLQQSVLRLKQRLSHETASPVADVDSGGIINVDHFEVS
jgi:hypothetical protein